MDIKSAFGRGEVLTEGVHLPSLEEMVGQKPILISLVEIVKGRISTVCLEQDEKSASIGKAILLTNIHRGQVRATIADH